MNCPAQHTRTPLPGMEEEQAALQSYGEHFLVCKNRPENDAHWDSKDRCGPWVGHGWAMGSGLMGGWKLCRACR